MREVSGSVAIPTELATGIGGIHEAWRTLKLRSIGSLPEAKVPNEWVKLGGRRIAYVFTHAGVDYDIVVDQQPTIESGVLTAVMLQKGQVRLLTISCTEEGDYFAKGPGATDEEIAELQKAIDALLLNAA